MAISLLSLFLSACGKTAQAERPSAAAPALVQPTAAPANQTAKNPQTGWTEAVPAAYQRASDRSGTVVPLSYDTLDYVRDSAPINKTAYVFYEDAFDNHVAVFSPPNRERTVRALHSDAAFFFYI